MYVDIMDSGPIFRIVHIWKTEFPYQIKISMWLLQRDLVLTKDNVVFLIRRSVSSFISPMPIYYLDLAHDSCYMQFSIAKVSQFVWKLVRCYSS